jgi:hypothetical protein
VPEQACPQVPDAVAEQSSPVAPDARAAEDIYEVCLCGRETAFGSVKGYAPVSDCFWCHGTGYRLTKRIFRAPAFDERAAQAQIRNLQLVIRKAAATLDDAAQRFRNAGRTKDAMDTHQAAVALREAVES